MALAMRDDKLDNDKLGVDFIPCLDYFLSTQ